MEILEIVLKHSSWVSVLIHFPLLQKSASTSDLYLKGHYKKLLLHTDKVEGLTRDRYLKESSKLKADKYWLYKGWMTSSELFSEA